MKSLKVLLIALLITLAALASLLWLAPAELALRWFGDRLGAIRLQGVSGSVWQGRAEQLVAFDVALGPLLWTVDRSSALQGNPRGRLQLAGSEVRASGDFVRSGAALRLSNLSANLPAALLAPALDIPALGLVGRIDLQASAAELRDGLLYSAQGRAEWRDLGVTGAASVRLPGVAIDFAPAADGAILAEVADLGGPLAIAGEVRLKDGHFVSETRLNLRQPDPQIEEALKFIGQRTADGGSFLRVEGQLHEIPQ